MDSSGMIRANIDAEKAKLLAKDPEGLKKLDGYLETCSSGIFFSVGIYED